MLYAPYALPTNATSANHGRAQPLGQPVIRITIESCLRPASKIVVSNFVISSGRYLSDSAIAKPQVGNATHAEEESLNPENSVLSSLYLCKRVLIAGRSTSAMLLMIKC